MGIHGEDAPPKLVDFMVQSMAERETDLDGIIINGDFVLKMSKPHRQTGTRPWKTTRSIWKRTWLSLGSITPRLSYYLALEIMTWWLMTMFHATKSSRISTMVLSMTFISRIPQLKRTFPKILLWKEGIIASISQAKTWPSSLSIPCTIRLKTFVVNKRV